MRNKLKKTLNKFCDNWFFIRQDIVSYLMSTILYISLCLIRDFSVNSLIYGLFDCLVFYLPFWYIRVCFSATYHSDKWEHCRKWTRIMLCSGVIVVWLFPIQYSLVGSITVAFMCCLVLYLVALETNEKKALKRENKVLQADIEKLLARSEDPKDKLLRICAEKHISQRDTQIATMYYIERRTPKQIWHWLCDNRENMEYDSVYKLLNRLNKKIKQ